MPVLFRTLFLFAALLALSAASPAFAQSEGLPLTDGTLAFDTEPEQEPDYTALGEIFPNGMPEIVVPQSFARSYSLPAHLKPADRKPSTKIEYSEGPFRMNMGTNVTTHKPSTVAPAASTALFDPRAVGGAAGGAGEMTGQFRYMPDKDWELYGTQKLGVVQGDGAAPALNESTTFGALYRLPGWMAGGRVGASFEVSPFDTRTRVEYRQPIGSAEGFIAAEQAQPSAHSDTRPPASVRAGLNRKF